VNTECKNCDENTDYEEEVNSLTVEPDVIYVNHCAVNGVVVQLLMGGWITVEITYFAGSTKQMSCQGPHLKT
jgi:hypothetical protein